jgi:hypothetical protein
MTMPVGMVMAMRVVVVLVVMMAAGHERHSAR